uniref:Uncharacterized protein n=1 Tax=Dunaliella tertiolecta TaxID=3047 RepID=A0A7S3VM91_DUNTE
MKLHSSSSITCHASRHSLNCIASTARASSRCVASTFPLGPLQLTARRPVQPARSAEGDVPQLDQDWREFRRKLLAQEKPEYKGRESEMNMELLRIQDPSLAAEGVWAHPTTTIEQGGVLLATIRAPEILMQDRMEQVVIFILSHKPEGSLGLILNRPSGQLLGKGRGGVRFPIANAPDRMQETFADSRVYVGGFTAQNFFHMMHPHDLPGSVKVLDGIYMGGVSAAVDKVATGKLPPSSFKFFSGCV